MLTDSTSDNTSVALFERACKMFTIIMGLRQNDVMSYLFFARCLCPQFVARHVRTCTLKNRVKRRRKANQRYFCHLNSCQDDVANSISLFKNPYLWRHFDEHLNCGGRICTVVAQNSFERNGESLNDMSRSLLVVIKTNLISEIFTFVGNVAIRNTLVRSPLHWRLSHWRHYTLTSLHTDVTLWIQVSVL